MNWMQIHWKKATGDAATVNLEFQSKSEFALSSPRNTCENLTQHTAEASGDYLPVFWVSKNILSPDTSWGLAFFSIVKSFEDEKN